METVTAPLGRREQRKLEIRTRIEDAAYRLFRQQGIEDTSIEQICVEADVARRTFYGHYANKHALLGGLGISRLYNQSQPMLELLMANHRSTRARLEKRPRRARAMRAIRFGSRADTRARAGVSTVGSIRTNGMRSRSRMAADRRTEAPPRECPMGTVGSDRESKNRRA